MTLLPFTAICLAIVLLLDLNFLLMMRRMWDKAGKESPLFSLFGSLYIESIGQAKINLMLISMFFVAWLVCWFLPWPHTKKAELLDTVVLAVLVTSSISPLSNAGSG